MITSGDGGGLPLPQNGLEWLALIAVILLVVWLVRRWLDDG